MKRLTATLLATFLLLAGCTGQAKDEKRLVVSTFGFGADQFQEHVIATFEEKYGAKVELETGANADRLSKLRANKGAPVVDVVLITDYFAQIGKDEGLFETIDPANVPNLAKLYDFAISEDGYGPIYTVNRLGLAYRTDLVATPPTSWQALWQPEYAGEIALPDLTISYGMPFLAALGQTFGTGETDIDAAFAALNDVKANALKFYSKTSEVTSLLQRGEIALAPAGDLFLVDLRQEGAPIGWLVPEEGSYLISNVAQVVKGTKQKALAEQFINHLLSKEVQEVAAREWRDAPTNREAVIEGDLANYLAYGEAGFANLKTQDQTFVIEHRDAWLDRFMKEIAQ